jgi:hypothetical protein
LFERFFTILLLQRAWLFLGDEAAVDGCMIPPSLNVKSEIPPNSTKGAERHGLDVGDQHVESRTDATLVALVVG